MAPPFFIAKAGDDLWNAAADLTRRYPTSLVGQAPERTASVVRAAFPDGSLCIRIFDELGTIFRDQDFADLYSQWEKPGVQRRFS